MKLLASLSLALLAALGAAYSQQGIINPRSFSSPPGPTNGSYGNDIVYYIVVDRFSDGNPGNNIPAYAFPDDPSLSPERRQANALNRALLPMIYDPSHSYMGMYWGGDLDGILQKMPYIADLGVTKIVLTPIVDNANGFWSSPSNDFYLRRSLSDKPPQPEYARIMTGYHGYWCCDWFRIDEHFRSPQDESTDPFASFRRVLNAAAGQGIGILMDITLNQTSPRGEFWPDQGAVYSDGDVMARFDMASALHRNTGWFHRFFYIDFTNPTPWQLEDGVFAQGMPDLNQSMPEVDAYLMNVTDFWLKFNEGGAQIAGFRVDAIKHVVPWFWKNFELRVIRTNPKAILMGEYFSGGYDNPASLKFASGTRYFSQYDFSSSMALRNFFAGNRSWNGRAYVLKQLISPEPLDGPSPWKQVMNPGGILEVPASARRVVPFSKASAWGLFLENHDFPRLRTQYPAMTDAAYVSALGFVLIAPRVPLLLYGVETALGYPWDPREQGLFGVGGDPFSRPMMIFPGDPGWNESIHTNLKTLIAYRKQHDYLRFGGGDFFEPEGSSNVDDLFFWRYQQARSDADSTIYAYATHGGTFRIPLPVGNYQVTDILQSGAVSVQGSILTLTLKPEVACVLHLSRPATTAAAH